MKSKQVLSMALALCLVFGSASALPEGMFTNSMSIIASAEDSVLTGKCGKNVTWTLKGSVMTLSGTGDMYDYDDPNTSAAPYSIYTITDLIVEKGVTSIGKYAFDTSNAGGQALKSVTLPEGLTKIGSQAFGGQSKVTKLKLPSTITSVESGAFWLVGVKELTIPAGFKKINDGAFATMSLEKLAIEEGVTDVGTEAFIDNKLLKSVTIPKSVTNIGKYAFGYYYGTSADHSETVETKINGFKISCYKDTAAEKYAVDNEFDYELLGLEHVEAKAATCSEEGNIEYWTYDGKFYSDAKATKEITKEETVVAKKEHTFGEWEQTVAPTCTQKGTETRKCSVCGETETRDVEAKGHSFEGAWVVTKKPTIVSTGVETRVCKVCKGEEDGGTETRSDTKQLAQLTTDRAFGDNRFDTALAIADQLKNANENKPFDNIIIASGADFADALSASYLAKAKNAPILIVANSDPIIDSVVSYIGKNASAEATIYIVGGEKAVPKSVDTKLKSFNVKRVFGSDRFETNIAVLNEAGVENQQFLIASGVDYADALSASAAGKPILLVSGKTKSMTQSQMDYLKKLTNKDKAFIIGGKFAVSKEIEDQVKGVFKSVQRVSGADRFETSVAVAKKFFKDPPAITIAYGLNYPDGLCGGPLAAAYGCPLILTTKQSPDAAAAYAKQVSAKAALTFGGSTLIDDATVNKIIVK